MGRSHRAGHLEPVVTSTQRIAERKWNASDRQNRNRHPDVLKDVGENESSDSNDEQKSDLITGTESNEEAGQQEQGESAE